jgi:hypothetical protein
MSDGLGWKVTGIYGHPEVARRKETWSFLHHLSYMLPTPWLCVGDFNEVSTLAEKQRVAP